MKKKLFLNIIVTTVINTTSFAQIPSPLQGPYIGLGAGLIIVHHSSGLLSDSGTPQTFTIAMNKYTPGANILAGYGFKIMESGHLGLEIDYTFDNLDTSFNQTMGNNNRFAKVESHNALGAAIRVGCKCERILGFIRFGVENRQFHIRANSFGLTPARVGRNTLDFKVRKTAFAPGVGAQFALTKNITATIEYRIALYGKILKTLFTEVDLNTTTFAIRPRVSTVMATFRYHF